MPPNHSKGDMPYPVGLADVEAGGDRLRPSHSKVSLPAHSSDPAAQHRDDRRRSTSEASAIAWGPMHPCYPHLNPHVPLASPLYSSTRIVRIPRDWMVAGDLAPTFANVYPEVLDSILSEEEFRRVVRHINDQLVAAHNPFGARAWIDTILGIATLWLWDDLGLSGIKGQLVRLENWIKAWNRDIGAKEGVQIIPLRRTAYMTIDFQIPDPEISPDPISRPETRQTTTHAPYANEIIPPRPALGV